MDPKCILVWKRTSWEALQYMNKSKWHAGKANIENKEEKYQCNNFSLQRIVGRKNKTMESLGFLKHMV